MIILCSPCSVSLELHHPHRDGYHILDYLPDHLYRSGTIDILVASTTTTGLQTLIKVANNYLCQHGLTFNAAKTECITFGKTHFTKSPTWSIDSVILTNATETGIKYLGAVLLGNSAMHADSRIAACRRAYYMLQPVGLHPRGLAPETISYVWRTALQPILTYAVQCVGISKTKLKEMDRIQARLLKSSLGISKYCRNTSFLQAMKVQPVSTLSDIYTLDLLSFHMKNNANGRTFYSYLLSHTSGQFSSHDNLVNRCMSICQSRDISLFKYLFLDDYVTSTKCIHKSFPINDGVIDCITYLLSDFTYENRVMLQSLLFPF